MNANLEVTSFSISNPNPCPGDKVTITYCILGTNPYYLPNSSVAVTLKDPALDTTTFDQPSAVGQWMLWGGAGALNPPMTVWLYSSFNGGFNEGPVSTTCTTKTVTVTIPTDVNWGATYNLVTAIGEGSNGVQEPWNAMEVHLPVTICTPNANQRSLIKSAEGTAAAGEKMIYWLDYTVSNDTNIVVTDALNSNLIFLDASPGYTGVTANQSCACNISWNLGNADAGSTPPFVAKGRLWIYVQVKPATPVGTAINNTAVIDGNSTGPLNSNPVNQVTGSGVNVSVAKEQLDASGTIPIASANNGDTVTYRLYFTLSGLGLKCFSDFDQLPNGTNYNGTAPPGWSAIGQDGNPATLANWQVQTRPGTVADHFLKATTTNYALLQDNCTASQNAQGNFCEGTIITEAYMGTTATDLGIALRENGQSGANWRGVWLLMSKDTSFGTGCSGNLGIQFNTGASRTVVGCYTAPTPPDSGQWYTIKAFIGKEGCNYRYRAKYWVQGTPEPAGWMVDYLDTTNNCNTDFECAGGTGMNAGWQWRPGFGNQGDVNAFDNWRVLANNYLQDAHLYDTIPVGIDFKSGSDSPAAQVLPSGSGPNEGMIQWDFTNNLNGAESGKTYDNSGYMQWQGTADCGESTSALNTAMVSATNPGGPWSSNTTNLSIICGTPTFTMTQTFTRTATPSATATPTSSATPSPTPSRTATPTSTITVVTATFTVTPSPTASATRTSTPSPSPSPTTTVTFSATPTRTATVTQSFSPTQTVTKTVSPSATPSGTQTSTQSPGPSATDTATPTDTLTHTPSLTQTVTRTVTPSITPSGTQTSTQSPGPSATDTATPTDTRTNTPSLTQTVTQTVTPSITPSGTQTSTQSPGPSATDTATPTDSYTITPTFTATVTYSVTLTDTDTRTASPTFTESPANTFSDTPTFSATPSDTPTLTVTPTRSSTRTSSATPSDSPTRSMTPTRTETKTITLTVTYSPTPVAMPHTLVLAAYNSAGERVRILYSGAAQYQLGQLNLSAPSFIGQSGQVSIGFPGILANGSTTVAWDGSNDGGSMVGGGMYTIKAEIIDNFGQVTTLQQSVQVIPGGEEQSLRIYNSAGELVRSIRLAAPVAGANNLRLEDTSFALQINPATGSAAQSLKIEVLGNSGYSATAWDGLNEQGVPVNSGTYVVQLVTHEAGREIVVSSRSVTVLKGADTVDPTASAFAAPNPVIHPGTAIAVYYDPSKLMGKVAACRLYNLSGELISQGTDPNNSGKILLGQTTALASGTYLARFEVRQGAEVLKARLIKIAVVR